MKKLKIFYRWLRMARYKRNRIRALAHSIVEFNRCSLRQINANSGTLVRDCGRFRVL